MTRWAKTKESTSLEKNKTAILHWCVLSGEDRRGLGFAIRTFWEGTFFGVLSRRPRPAVTSKFHILLLPFSSLLNIIVAFGRNYEQTLAHIHPRCFSF